MIWYLDGNTGWFLDSWQECMDLREVKVSEKVMIRIESKFFVD